MITPKIYKFSGFYVFFLQHWFKFGESVANHEFSLSPHCVDVDLVSVLMNCNVFVVKYLFLQAVSIKITICPRMAARVAANITQIDTKRLRFAANSSQIA